MAVPQIVLSQSCVGGLGWLEGLLFSALPSDDAVVAKQHVT